MTRGKVDRPVESLDRSELLALQAKIRFLLGQDAGGSSGSRQLLSHDELELYSRICDGLRVFKVMLPAGEGSKRLVMARGFDYARFREAHHKVLAYLELHYPRAGRNQRLGAMRLLVDVALSYACLRRSEYFALQRALSLLNEVTQETARDSCADWALDKINRAASMIRVQLTKRPPARSVSTVIDALAQIDVLMELQFPGYANARLMRSVLSGRIGFFSHSDQGSPELGSSEKEEPRHVRSERHPQAGL